MFRVCIPALLAGMFVLAGGSVGQDAKKDDKKDDTMKVKGRLPQHWAKIGLSDTQKQTIYTIQGKYAAEIDSLHAKIREIESKRDKEMRGVLTDDQKKALEAAVLGKEKDK
jgi:hypothetical protein